MVDEGLGHKITRPVVERNDTFRKRTHAEVMLQAVRRALLRSDFPSDMQVNIWSWCHGKKNKRIDIIFHFLHIEKLGITL